jgi:glutathione S-transferase
MTLELFAHPFSSYCQKALIALYESEIPFTYRFMEDEGVGEELASLWPHRKFPILRDDGKVILEATIIIEHLQVRFPGPVRLIPSDPAQAVEVRMLDRFFDNYVMTPQGKFVLDALRPAESPVWGRRSTEDAGCELRLARPASCDPHLGRWRSVLPRRLRCRAFAVLCRLDLSHSQPLSRPRGLPSAAAEAALVRARRR